MQEMVVLKPLGTDVPRPRPQVTMRRALLALSLIASGAFVNGCDESTASTASDAGDTTCMPSRSQWDEGVKDVVEAHCGNCHSDSPTFGAPYSLLDLDANLQGEPGQRRVDRMAQVSWDGTMPPVGVADPGVQARDVIADWASCGDVRVTASTGLQVDRPVFQAPPIPADGLTTIDLTATEEPVSSDTLDGYHEVEFTQVVESDVFIRRIDAVIDDARVLHHLVFAKVGAAANGAQLTYLYTWAPGTGEVGFPDGGIRLSPGDTLLLELHYNNGAGYEDVMDSSGVRLWVGPTEGTEYAMVGPGPGALDFEVPPQSEATIESTCVVTEDVTLVATMPHMHEIGTGFEMHLARKDGPDEPLLNLRGWDFETQLFYELPVEVKAGDTLMVRCLYANPNPWVVTAGQGTRDEMCFAFTYTTPPLANFCEPPATSGLSYQPGSCIADPRNPANVTATFAVLPQGPAFDVQGTIPDGLWVIESAVVAADGTFIQVASFDVAGQLRRAGTALSFDADLAVKAPGMQRSESFSQHGTLPQVTSGSLLADVSCSENPSPAPLLFGTFGGKPAVRYTIEGIGEVHLWMLLSEVP